MNFANINDPAGVKALLDRLRVSQAWQDLTVAAQDGGETSVVNSDELSKTPVSQPESTSVAALLSQLQAAPLPAPSLDNRTIPRPATPASFPDEPSLPKTVTPSSSKKTDIRSYTFQQALPHIAGLADDSVFITAITQMKKEQDDLERRLVEDRHAILKKYEEKIKVAKTKASMIGSGVSKRDADTINEAFKKELQMFDRDRVLPAWDGLIAKQQSALASLDVPAMFVTNQVTDRERQQRVIQVLEGFIMEKPS